MRIYPLIVIAALWSMLSLGCGSDTDADALTGLTLSSATPLTPDFSASELSYSVDVSLIVSEVRITPIAKDSNAIITINGVAVDSGNVSTAIALDLGVNEISIEVNTARTYTISINRGTPVLEQLTYGKASNTGDGDFFSSRVSLSGDTLAVSAFHESSGATGIDGDQNDNTATESGAVYIFIRTGATWTQQAYIKASNTGIGDNFGTSLSLSGDTLAVGARSEDSNANGVDGDQNNNSLFDSGAVYVFKRNGTTWTQQAYIKASNSDDVGYFGDSVSLLGDTLAVGAIGDDSNATGVDGNQSDDSLGFSGAVYVFTRDGSTWVQQAYIKASNTGFSDKFGFSVSLSGETLAVGAAGEPSSTTGVDGDQSDDSLGDCGAVYIFVRNGTTWTQQAYIKASNTGANDFFGFDLSLSGDTLAVGANREDSGASGVDGDQYDDSSLATNSGAVYVFVRDGATWTQQAYIKASNPYVDRLFGVGLSLSGDILAVGSIGDHSNATGIGGDQSNFDAGNSGAVYVFTRNGTTWKQEAYVKASNTGEGDGFGGSVSLSGERLVIGAFGEKSNAKGMDGDQNDNSADNGGAIYIFE